MSKKIILFYAVNSENLSFKTTIFLQIDGIRNNACLYYIEKNDRYTVKTNQEHLRKICEAKKKK